MPLFAVCFCLFAFCEECVSLQKVILNFGLYRYGFILFRESYLRQTCSGGNILVKPV